MPTLRLDLLVGAGVFFLWLVVSASWATTSAFTAASFGAWSVLATPASAESGAVEFKGLAHHFGELGFLLGGEYGHAFFLDFGTALAHLVAVSAWGTRLAFGAIPAAFGATGFPGFAHLLERFVLDFFQLGFLVFGETELLGDHGGTEDGRAGLLQLDLLDPFELLGLEDIGEFGGGILLALFGLLQEFFARLFELLTSFLGAQVTEFFHDFLHFLAEALAEFFELGFLVLGEVDFFLDLLDAEQLDDAERAQATHGPAHALAAHSGTTHSGATHSGATHSWASHSTASTRRGILGENGRNEQDQHQTADGGGERSRECRSHDGTPC